MSMIGAPAAIRLPYPHPGQQAVLNQRRRFNWLAAGRRWRKTTLSLHLITEGCLQGGRYIWGAPTFDQTRIGMEELQKAWGGNGDFNLSRMTAQLGRGKVFFRSMDSADNVRGYSADGVVMDECGFIKPGVYHEVLRPMLMDTDGWLLAKGTPNGRNWFWVEWQQSHDDPDAMAWQIPTLGVGVTESGLERRPHPLENPGIDFDEMARIYQRTPEQIFRQEYLAEFIEDGGGVFRNVSGAVADVWQSGPIADHQYVMGVDWGKHNDFTVLAVIDAARGHLCYLDRFNQIDYVFQAGRLRALYERFRPWQVLAESNSMGEPIIEQLQRDNIPVRPFVTTNASKKGIIEGLSLAFERGRIMIPNEPVLIGELQAYQAERLPSGNTRYGAPAGMHDDTVMALALAWSAADLATPAGVIGDMGDGMKLYKGRGEMDNYTAKRRR